jgi:multidrug resistance protein MdtO
MALPAGDTLTGPRERGGALLAELVRALGPRPGRLAFAVRLALICALTTLVVEIYQTPDPALTVYVAFFFNKPDRAESVLLSVVFTILISFIIAIVIVMAMFVIDAPLWRVALMTAFSVGFLFVAFASKLRPLAGTLTLIVGYGLDLLGTVHGGEIATRALLYVWLFIGIPAGVSVVVNLLLAPAPRRLAGQALAYRLRAAAAVLRDSSERNREALMEYQREGMEEIHTWLKLAGAERTSPPGDIEALRQAAHSTSAILSWVYVSSRGRVGLIPLTMRERLAQTLEDMASILMRGAYPIEITLESDALTALPARTAEAWADMQEILARFTEKPAAEPAAAPAASKPAGFFLPDAFTDPQYVRYALKTTAAAMFCYVLYTLLDWPSIHTCFITCYIVSLGTTAETIEKLSLRILGCIVGGAAGIVAIVYVMPFLTSIGALLTVVFVGGLAAAWVAAGSPRISYAGFQLAFAFFLCVIQGPSPAFDLSIARDRIIGILLGNVVVYLLFTHTWPTSITKGIDPALAAVLRKLSAMSKAASVITRGSLAAQVQGALGSIAQNLHLAHYEPTRVRPSESWLQARRRAVEVLGALEGPLFMRPAKDTADVGDRLNRSADLIDSHVEDFSEALALIQPLDSEVRDRKDGQP